MHLKYMIKRPQTLANVGCILNSERLRDGVTLEDCLWMFYRNEIAVSFFLKK